MFNESEGNTNIRLTLAFEYEYRRVRLLFGGVSLSFVLFLFLFFVFGKRAAGIRGGGGILCLNVLSCTVFHLGNFKLHKSPTTPERTKEGGGGTE